MLLAIKKRMVHAVTYHGNSCMQLVLGVCLIGVSSAELNPDHEQSRSCWASLALGSPSCIVFCIRLEGLCLQSRPFNLSAACISCTIDGFYAYQVHETSLWILQMVACISHVSHGCRGGIPICFPQFGVLGPLGQHGFARNSVFEVTEGSGESVTLSFRPSAEQQKQFPHQFHLLITVRLPPSQLAWQTLTPYLHLGVISDRSFCASQYATRSWQDLLPQSSSA